MGNKGVMLQIPNKYGNYLSDLLEVIPFNEYLWLVDNDEIHLIENSEPIGQFLFKDNETIIQGNELYNIARDNKYYMIFVNLRAFFKDGIIKSVTTYKEFLDSDCQLIIVVWDCSYVMYWCKDNELVSQIYEMVMSKGFENVKYIEEDDLLEEKYKIN